MEEKESTEGKVRELLETVGIAKVVQATIIGICLKPDLLARQQGD